MSLHHFNFYKTHFYHYSANEKVKAHRNTSFFIIKGKMHSPSLTFDPKNLKRIRFGKPIYWNNKSSCSMSVFSIVPLTSSNCGIIEKGGETMKDSRWFRILYSILEKGKVTANAEIEIPNDYNLYHYIFSFGDGAEVLEPKEIRMQMKEMINKMAEKYLIWQMVSGIVSYNRLKYK